MGLALIVNIFQTLGICFLSWHGVSTHGKHCEFVSCRGMGLVVMVKSVQTLGVCFLLWHGVSCHG